MSLEQVFANRGPGYGLNRGLVGTLAGLLLLTSPAVSVAASKVAFLADQGVGSNARAVLSLVADEGTDLLLLQGDLGYGDDLAARWEQNLNDALGRNFPVLSVVGNHEDAEWPAYENYIRQRVDRADGLRCSGRAGVKALCRFGNLDIVQVAPGIRSVPGVSPDDGYEQFIRDSFSGAANRWRICSWHKNQRRMQTGDKGDAVGWGVFDACLDAGALVAMGHEHAYSRTWLLSDYEQQTVVHRNSAMTLQPGRSFAFVSGLGGYQVRPQQRFDDDWWASIYTADQGATHGALFCSFETRTAECYFKAIDGAVPDRFSLRLGTGSTPPGDDPDAGPDAGPDDGNDQPMRAAGDPSLPAVFSRTDKREFRWLAADASAAGGVGNIWISAECAEQLGGVDVQGDWNDLLRLAPGLDAIANPCQGVATRPATPAPTASPAQPASGAGYVFSRTDKSEQRWIDVDATGTLGSIWIDAACANRLGGTSARGDWGDLIALAPAFDGIASPCH